MSEERKVPTQIRFDFEKSHFFRTIHVDGVFGGPTPQGLIQLAFFSERLPVPKTITHEITEQGVLGAEIAAARVSRASIYRELEINAMMTPDVARAVRDFLNEKLEQLDKLSTKDLPKAGDR